GVQLKLPAVDPDLAGRLAGAFNRFGGGLTVTHAWTPASPVLVVMIKDEKLLFAIMWPDLLPAEYDLSQYSPANPPTAKLASLNATIVKGGLTLEATGVKLAVYPGGGKAEGTLKALGSLTLDDGRRAFGPLKVAWEGVEVTGQTGAITVNGTVSAPAEASLRARV